MSGPHKGPIPFEPNDVIVSRELIQREMPGAWEAWGKSETGEAPIEDYLAFVSRIRELIRPHVVGSSDLELTRLTHEIRKAVRIELGLDV